MRPRASMTARIPLWVGSLALTLAYACTLDFDKFEGEAAGGAGAGATGGGGGVTTTTSTGGQGGMLPISCSNGEKDGTESDVDCGGDCLGCENGDACGVFDDCLSSFCSGGMCAPCTSPADCADAPDTFCDAAAMGGTCSPVKPGGTSCVGNEECESTFCSDDVCCDVACDGTCESCLGNETGGVSGVCASVTGTTDPADECGAQVCNGVNACVDLCALEPTPPGGMCPAACTGGCAAGVCTIDCAVSSCTGVVTCPPGFACNVACSGMNACSGGVIACPDAYACDVVCAGGGACRDAAVNCSATGTCSMSCSADMNVCRDANLNCGANDCTATCAGATNLPMVNCSGGACACTGC